MAESQSRLGKLKFALERLHLLPKWLWELRGVPDVARSIWIFLGVLAVVFIALDWFGYWREWPREQRVLFAGWLLEVAGLGAAGFGLWRLEQTVRPHPDTDSVRGWLKRFPLVRRDTVIGALSAHLSIGTPRVRAYATVKRAPGKNVDERLERLERALDEVESRITSIHRNMDDELDALRKQLDAEVKAREAQTGELGREYDQKLEGVLVGGIHFEVIGLFWILIGITAATVPEFIVNNWWRWAYDLLEVPL